MNSREVGLVQKSNSSFLNGIKKVATLFLVAGLENITKLTNLHILLHSLDTQEITTKHFHQGCGQLGIIKPRLSLMHLNVFC